MAFVQLWCNNVVINCTEDLHMRAHIIKCSECLKRKLTIELTDAVDWKSRSSVVYSLPKYLCLFLSKILLNFAGTSHQLHTQGIWSSELCRWCLLEEETDTLYSLDWKHSLFMNFKQDLIIKLREDMWSLLEGYILPCLLLESMWQKTL